MIHGSVQSAEPDASNGSDSRMSLVEKIRDRSAVCGVIGLGYVGLPLVMELVRAGFKVIGYDVSESKVAQLREGVSYVGDVPSSEVAKAISEGRFEATTEPALAEYRGEIERWLAEQGIAPRQG